MIEQRKYYDPSKQVTFAKLELGQQFLYYRYLRVGFFMAGQKIKPLIKTSKNTAEFVNKEDEDRYLLMSRKKERVLSFRGNHKCMLPELIEERPYIDGYLYFEKGKNLPDYCKKRVEVPEGALYFKANRALQKQVGEI